ncbi:MAG: RNA methyltransferase [Bacteroidales bacterium]|nr:RNA methyltransferase [Bacteroidales bacterium]
MPISKNKIKFIKSLELKKFRKENKMFVAEGNKLIHDNIEFFECKTLIATQEWFDANKNVNASEVIVATKDELSKASFLKTPQDVIGVFSIPEYSLNIDELKNKLSIVLDTIQDPGNMGTIIRLADWFGIENIICSNETTDCYSPKAIQATMGAIARVKIHYTSLSRFLQDMKGCNIYGTFLEGSNIYDTELSHNGLIVMGNEGNGINKDLYEYITHKLHIPNYPPERETSESLNVAIATAIICSEFRRR